MSRDRRRIEKSEEQIGETTEATKNGSYTDDSG